MQTRRGLGRSTGKALVAGLCVFAMCMAAGGATYHVDPAGSNGDGLSWETAKTTIQAGVNLCFPGDTVLIRGDNAYFEAVTTPRSGTPSNRITYRGEPGTGAGALPVVHGSVNLPSANFVPVSGSPNTWWINQNPHASGVGGVYAAPAGTTIASGVEWVSYLSKTSTNQVEAQAGSFYDTKTAGIYIRTHDGSAPTSLVIQASTVNNGIYVDDSWITVENMRVKFAREIGIFVYNGYGIPPTNVCVSSNVVCQNAHPLNTDRPSIYIRSGLGHEVANNTTYDGGVGVQVNSTAIGTSVHGNILYRSTAGYGLIISDPAPAPVYGNTCYLNKYGIQFSGGDNTKIHGNVCYSNSVQGIAFGGTATNNLIYNNLLYANGVNLYLHTSPYNTVFNNTLYDARENYAGSLVIRNTSSNTHVFNNIFWQRDTDFRNYCIQMSDTASVPGFQANYNDIYITGGVAYIGYIGATAYATFVAWQAGGYDVNGISADPLFVDPTSWPPDLHLTKDSPCCDDVAAASFSGVSAPSADIDGDARPFGSGYDLGSDEYYEAPTVPSGTIVILL